MKNFLFLAFFSFCFIMYSGAQELKTPSFEEALSLQSTRNPQISPDGKHVLFQVGSTDWEENRYDTEIWISKNGGTPFPLTNNAKNSSSNPQWSPDGKWISFTSNKSGKSQIQVMRLEGGEAFQLTNTKAGVYGFEWSPDGSQIAFVQSEDKEKEEKTRKDKYGSFAVEDGEYSLSRLWTIKFDPGVFTETKLPKDQQDSTLVESRKVKVLLDSVPYTITSFAWSPDGKKIAFGHQPNPLINTFFKSDISILDIESKAVRPLVQNPSSDRLIAWSPDSKSILYGSSLDNTTSNYYLNSKIFSIDIDGTNNKALAEDFDENLNGLTWNEKGIFATAYQKTLRPLYRIDPNNGSVKPILQKPARIYGFTISKDGEKIAFYGNTDHGLNEVYLTAYPNIAPKKISNSSKQIEGWKLADSEVISWKSKDGATIEGILQKPKDYDPNKKYPLFVIIHGGPTGISVPGPTSGYVYPVLQWLDKGALVLMPNYRGSAGYGEAFRSLNVKNLGVGDAWDVESGVDYLVKKGIVNADKVASMGWSQGGYISAFLTTNSNKFKAICVGAGISNWMTYYVNTDIHPFTRQYLKATPWSDKAIYEKTSPMTNINKATTPTLIQHGEFDKRVPIANAFELFQGLQDVGVETKLIVYKGFGHGITKPKERLAAVWHNWQWFGKYIWGEEIEIPMD